MLMKLQISWKHWLFERQKRSKYDSQIPFQQRSKPLFWLMSILYHIIRFSRVFSSLSWLDSVLKVITGMSVTSYKKRHSKASRCEVSHGLEVQKCDHRRWKGCLITRLRRRILRHQGGREEERMLKGMCARSNHLLILPLIRDEMILT